MPQQPQLFGSDSISVYPFPQSRMHVPLLHTRGGWLAFVQRVQKLSQDPQWSISVLRLTHPPLQVVMPAGQASIVRVVAKLSVTVVIGRSVKVVCGLNGTAAGVVLTGFMVTKGVAAGIGVRVGTGVWKVYCGEVVETLMGAFVATCSGAIRTGNSGIERLPAVRPGVPMPASRAEQGAGTREMNTRQNTRNRITVFREEAGAAGENTDIQETFSRVL